MKQQSSLKPKTELAKTAGRALKRAAKRARIVARQHGTPIYVEVNGQGDCAKTLTRIFRASVVENTQNGVYHTQYG